MRDKNTFTIHTELLGGKLNGARNIYMGANSTCHLYVIPREEITLANAINDISGQPAFYILLSSLDAKRKQAYIGQTTDFANRKNDHVQKKDFWNIALIFISDNHKIYGDDVKYLEYLGIEAAQNAGSFELLNGINPKRPNIAPYRINDMEVFFRDIQLLCNFYGCNIFETITHKFTKEMQKMYDSIKRECKEDVESDEDIYLLACKKVCNGQSFLPVIHKEKPRGIFAETRMQTQFYRIENKKLENQIILERGKGQFGTFEYIGKNAGIIIPTNIKITKKA